MEDKPTEFEVVTAIGFEYFYRSNCDIVVLEVGLGGTNDATNVISKSEVSVITAIELDHTLELGATISLIAKEKAGIIKDNGSVVYYRENEEATKVIEETCARHNASFYSPDFKQLHLISHSISGSVFDYCDLKNLQLSLIGKYQIYNAALVICLMNVLVNKGYNISGGNIRAGLSQTILPDRFEIARENPYFIMDGGHNPHGVTGTIETIKEVFAGKDITILMGVMADKNVDEIIKIISPVASRFITVTPKNDRAMNSLVLAGKIKTLNIEAFAFDSIYEAVKSALNYAGNDGVVCALGTFYMYSEVKAALLSCN